MAIPKGSSVGISQQARNNMLANPETVVVDAVADTSSKNQTLPVGEEKVVIEDKTEVARRVALSKPMKCVEGTIVVPPVSGENQATGVGGQKVALLTSVKLRPIKTEEVV